MSKPAHKIRSGVLQVTIWRNTSEKASGTARQPHPQLQAGDDIWKETDSLGFDDLLPMAKLLDQAHTWIVQQQQADAKARKKQRQPLITHRAGGNARPPNSERTSTMSTPATHTIPSRSAAWS